MNRTHSFISLIFILPTIFSLGICQNIDQRVNRLETRLDSLINALKNQSSDIAIGDTFFDNSSVLYGVLGTKGTILNKTYFVINHNNAWKIPYWGAYYASSSNLQGTANRTNDFKPDPELPVGSRSELEDYRNSGYDRGHNAPAADFKRSNEAMAMTFLLSNMSPQTPKLNRDIWRILEEQTRNMVLTGGEAWIFTGNAFLSPDSHFVNPREFIGPDNVAVPTHCFKAVLYKDNNGNYTAYAFLIPNQRETIPGTPADYLISVDKLEKITNYDFFYKLDDSLENRTESAIPSVWPR